MKEDTWENLGEAIAKALNKAISEIAAELDTEEDEDTTPEEKCEKCAAREEEKLEKCKPSHEVVRQITVTYYDGEEEDCAVIYPEEGARAGANATYALCYAIGEVMAREALVDKDKAAQAILRAVMKFGAKEAGLV